MNVQAMFKLCAAGIASMFKGKDFATIKDEFGVEGNFTAEDEEKIKQENPWIMDTLSEKYRYLDNILK